MKSNHVTVTFTHAAPFIREKLIGAVREACESNTKKGREAGFAKAFGYADSLAIMAASSDTELAEGIHLLDHYSKKDLARVRRFLSDADNFEKLMGIPAPEPAENWEY